MFPRQGGRGEASPWRVVIVVAGVVDIVDVADVAVIGVVVAVGVSSDALVPTARGPITRRRTTAPEAATELREVLDASPGDSPRPPRAASAYTLLLANAWPGSPVAPS